MIRLVKLRDYKSPKTIDDNLKKHFLDLVDKDVGLSESVVKNSILLLEIFLDCHDKRLTHLDFNKSLNNVFSDFIAFIYTEVNLSYSYANSTIHYLKKIIFLFCKNEGFKEQYIAVCSSVGLSEDVKLSIKNYNKNSQNKLKIKYYRGWFSMSSDGKKVKLYLHNFYLKFGDTLTNKVSEAMGNVFLKYPSSTAMYKAKVFSQVLNVLSKTLDDSNEFYFVGRSTYINKYVENIFLILKVNCKIRKGNLPYFYKEWQSIIKLIQDVFIESKLWGKPLYDLFSPDFKESNSTFKTHRVIIDGELTSKKLITNIPLHVTDSKAIAILVKNLENDINHVIECCDRTAESTMGKFHLRQKLAKDGLARTYKRNVQSSNAYVDMSIPKNQCCTWNKYGFDLFKMHPNNNQLLYSGITASEFVNKYSIVQSGMLYPFLYLIVNEHPEITNSFLENFKLYDKNGNKSGFIKSANSSLAVGYKLRKGYKNAEQRIVLTERSKYLFECLELLTRQAREYLKKNKNDDYKYLLLCSSTLGEPKRLRFIVTQSSVRSLELTKYITSNSSFLNNEQARSISGRLSVTKFRASCAVLIYIKTNSLNAISEALGHSKPCPKLLKRYLPIPILKYLQDRWVRIFQYSIIFESMKDSIYLFDVINFSKNDLEEFLLNHKLKSFSKHMINGNLGDLDISDEYNSKINDEYKLIIPMSTNLYSILDCIIDLVESKTQETKNLTNVGNEWYETAKFVIKTLDESVKRTSDPEIIDIINHTYNKAAVLSKLEEVIYE